MTYDEVAILYDVTLCESCERPVDHRKGAVEPRQRLIHWRMRRVHKDGLYHFLKLIAQVRVLHYERLPVYEQLWAQNIWARTHGAHDLHLRFPDAWQRVDRASARWLVHLTKRRHPGTTINPAVTRWMIRRTT